jgi:hypothetical protein
MAKYLILIYGSEQEWDAMGPEDLSVKGSAHGAFAAAAGARLVSGAELESVSTATTLRASGGEAPTVTDGPFMETKEELGGLYVLEARDLDHALALASMTPIMDGGVEVRPLSGYEVVEAS